jgi:hypothetical protein
MALSASSRPLDLPLEQRGLQATRSERRLLAPNEIAALVPFVELP